MLRRTNAIDAVAEYSLFEEGITCRLPRDKRAAKVERNDPPKFKIEVLALPPPSCQENKVKQKKDFRPTSCFICLDKFHKHGGVTKHIKRKHLQYIKPGDRIVCPRCDMVLENKMSLQRHVYDVHKTVT